MADTRLAVLIDGENICGTRADALFAKIDKLGSATVRRVYGDFRNSQAHTWLGAVARHGIVAIQVCGGENAADIALILDAMDLMHSDSFNGICIASSDRDFAPLATRIREKGLLAYGFGREEALCRVSGSYSKLLFLDRAAKKNDAPPHPAAEALKIAIDKIGRDGWASVSELGQLVKARDYEAARLTTLIKAAGGFQLHPDGKRVRVAR
jgi:NYN domain-containing protein